MTDALYHDFDMSERPKRTSTGPSIHKPSAYSNDYHHELIGARRWSRTGRVLHRHIHQTPSIEFIVVR